MIVRILILPIFILTLVSCSSSEEEIRQKGELMSSSYSPNHSYNVAYNDEAPKIDLSISQMQLQPNQYVNWVNDKGLNYLTKSKEIGEFNYQLKHLPVEYMISNELRKNDVSKTELDSLLSDYEGMEYYELKIDVDDFYDETAKYGIADMQEYQERIVYMSFAMQNDLTMKVDNTEEITCKLFHFERTYGVAPYATFLFGFSKEEMGSEVSERTVVFNDNLFNKGLIKFNWQTAEIENVPKIQVL